MANSAAVRFVSLAAVVSPTLGGHPHGGASACLPPQRSWIWSRLTWTDSQKVVRLVETSTASWIEPKVVPRIAGYVPSTQPPTHVHQLRDTHPHPAACTHDSGACAVRPRAASSSRSALITLYSTFQHPAARATSTIGCATTRRTSRSPSGRRITRPARGPTRPRRPTAAVTLTANRSCERCRGRAITARAAAGSCPLCHRWWQRRLNGSRPPLSTRPASNISSCLPGTYRLPTCVQGAARR